MTRALLFALLPALLLPTSAAGQYCAASHTQNCQTIGWISNVSIGSLNHSSGCVAPPSYEDNTALPGPTLTRGGASPIAVTIDQVFTQLNSYSVAVYCDWNGDFDFDDTDERFDLPSPAVAPQMTWTGLIMPPLGAVATTRMRVRMFWTVQPNAPCGAAPFGYGNTEDYTIHTQDADLAGAGSAAPGFIAPGNPTFLTVAVTSVLPPSPPVGVAVVANLTALGGSLMQPLFDDGISGGDLTAGDRVFSLVFTTSIATASGTYVIPFLVTDSVPRVFIGTLTLIVGLPNDDCGDAIQITTGANGPFSNVGATDSGVTGSCGFQGSPGHNDVWFVFVAPCTALYQIDTDGGACFDTSLEVYDSCGGTSLACNEDGATCGLASLLTVNLTAGTPYWIRVASWSPSATGSFPLNVNVKPSAGQLAWVSPLPGTIGWTMGGGLPGGTYLHLIALAPGAFPNGWFFGIDIALQDLVAQIGAGFPFSGLLDSCGGNVLGPIGGIPTGLPVYSVAILMTGPGLSGVTSVTNPASHVVP